MANPVFFSATMQKSPASLPAQIMTEHGLKQVVYFVLRGGTDEQRAYLAELLGSTLLTRVPLRRARREMWLCRTHALSTMHSTLSSFDTVLQHVFGPKCRIRVRVCFYLANPNHRVL